MNIKKLIPFIVFSAVGLLVFILTLVSLLVPVRILFFFYIIFYILSTSHWRTRSPNWAPPLLTLASPLWSPFSKLSLIFIIYFSYRIVPVPTVPLLSLLSLVLPSPLFSSTSCHLVIYFGSCFSPMQWYTIESTTSTLAGVEMCKATQTQSWDLEVVESSGVNCTNLPNGQSRNWRDTCEYDFCRNKAAVFIITRGLLAYAATGTLLALIVYLVGAFGPGVAYQVHASAAVVFCVGLCSLLPLALAVFLFGIGLTAGVHQDQVDYVASSNAGDGLVYDRETTACQLDVSCTSLAGEGTFTRPCFTVPPPPPFNLTLSRSLSVASPLMIAVYPWMWRTSGVPRLVSLLP